jgi:hypothetical protein
LEKLVTSEYELGFNYHVEIMALRSIYGRDTQFQRVSDVARAMCRGDFPGIGNIDILLRMRCVLIPRTMLKIVHKFTASLVVLNGPGAEDLKNRLPAGYAFWLLLLVAMYYRLDPAEVDGFVFGRGPIHSLMSRREVDPQEWGSGPLREFCQYAESFGASGGTAMQVPPPDVLLPLSRIVRENACI